MSATLRGHLLALFAVSVWGTTFVSTKLLLQHLSPVQILFDRFLLAWLVLWLLHPVWRGWEGWKQELHYAAMGATGVTLYFLTENYALQFTQASNVGLLVSSAPLLTALLAHFFSTDEGLSRPLVIGSLIAFAGVALVMFNGSVVLQLNPLGDLLALSAGGMWALYSTLLKRVSKPHGLLHLTRRIFGYGLLTMLPALWLTGYTAALPTILLHQVWPQLLFLGLIASALCYVVWNNAVQLIGAVKASNYIYLIPAITMLTAAIILREQITPLALLGAALIVAGVWFAEHGSPLLRRTSSSTRQAKYQAPYASDNQIEK
ncbi:DMT family transporter [Chitinilyticum piscinae]|uniref:DMT family transporter n=1 Tax=Chitinilyticum piscinae TaxID=2866724 RepID=A0A8J7FLM5_9NEIS|nr:DMT family transporter [Chitinilyticum piscinae]MBE9608549.1 DMT family transporter [Chitinilyticum piscinae]